MLQAFDQYHSRTPVEETVGLATLGVCYARCDFACPLSDITTQILAKNDQRRGWRYLPSLRSSTAKLPLHEEVSHTSHIPHGSSQDSQPAGSSSAHNIKTTIRMHTTATLHCRATLAGEEVHGGPRVD